nr:MAG TPA: endonuclease-like protein [Caudoviricetes sp.]
MLKESGNLIEENIPITKDLLDFAKANNYKISLKTGGYSKEPLKVIRSKNNQKLVDDVAQLYLDKMMYPPFYFEIFGFTALAGFVGMIKRTLGEAYIECTILYPEEIQEKHRQSCLLNLGVEYPSQSKDMRAKTEATNLRKRGVKCNLQLIDHSGDNNCMKKPETRAKARATNELYYGGPSPRCSRDVVRKAFLDDPEKLARFDALEEIRHGLRPATDIFDLDFNEGQKLFYAKELGLKTKSNYSTEIKAKRLLDCLDIAYTQQAKKLHGVRNANGNLYELDFWIPQLKLGIEINGLDNHSVNFAANGVPKTPEYHFEKFKAFHQSGILMLSFTCYEQDRFKPDYENIIKHHLLGEPLNISKEFLEFNQIKSLEESLNYGLFDPSRFTGNFEDHQHQRFINGKLLYEYWDCGIIKS